MLTVLKKTFFLILLLQGLCVIGTARADSQAISEKITQGKCPVGTIKSAPVQSLQASMPGYHLCKPAQIYQLELIMSAAQGALSSDSPPGFRFKTTYMAKGVKVLPDPLEYKGKLILHYYQNQTGKLATIEGYCTTAKGHYGKYSRFDVYHDKDGMHLKNLRKYHNAQDSGAGCDLDIFKLPFVNYQDVGKLTASLYYVYDMPQVCLKGQVRDGKACSCPQGLILQDATCVSQSDHLSTQLTFNFKAAQAGLKNKPTIHVDVRQGEAKGVTFDNDGIDGSGSLTIGFKNDSIGSLATIVASCRVQDGQPGRKVFLTVNYDGSKVYMVKALDTNALATGHQCDLVLQGMKHAKFAVFKDDIYKASFDLSYRLADKVLLNPVDTSNRVSIPITLGYQVQAPKLLAMNRVCLPDNTYVRYLNSIDPSTKHGVFKRVNSPDIHTKIKEGGLKLWRFNLEYDPQHPEKVIGQSIVISADKSCDNKFCGDNFCVNKFQVRYTVKSVKPLVLQCEAGRFNDVCNNSNLCRGVRCTPQVTSNGEPVTIKCVEMGPYVCKDQTTP